MIITAVSGFNDSALGKSTAKIVKFMQGADELASKKSLLRNIFPVETSDSWGVNFSGRTSLSSNFKPGAENATFQQASTQDGYNKTVEDYEWRLEFEVSRKMRDDNKLNNAFTNGAELVKAHYNTQEMLGGAFMTAGIATSFSFEGQTFATTGGDGKALFATDHPSKTGNTSAQSNLYDLEFSDTNLTTAALYLTNQVDDNGRKLNIVPNTIIIPFGTAADAAQRQEIISVLRADGDPNSADRRGVYNAGLYNVITWNYLGAPTGMTGGKSWWILCDIDYVMAHKPYVFLERLDLVIRDYIENKTWSQVFQGYARYACDTTNDWHGIIACIPGLGS